MMRSASGAPQLAPGTAVLQPSVSFMLALTALARAASSAAQTSVVEAAVASDIAAFAGAGPSVQVA